MTDLLARFAECAFWMGRYMERAENLARAIDVNESFARDPAQAVPVQGTYSGAAEDFIDMTVEVTVHAEPGG